jgi:enoyl-CoA hydratase/carnithine racemase
MRVPSRHCVIEQQEDCAILRLSSPDMTNRLNQACVISLTEEIEELATKASPLIIAGNEKFFSVGAELSEIAALTGPEAYGFSLMGQRLMNAIEKFPAPVYAAIQGYCMGGGLDLALACHHRIASPRAVFGHRGAALGLITGWGGTQRLPRVVGKGHALQLLIAAEEIRAPEALRLGLINAIAEDPIAEVRRRIVAVNRSSQPAMGLSAFGDEEH